MSSDLFYKYFWYPLWTFKDGDYCLGYLKKFEKSQYLSAAQLDAERLAKTKALVAHAYHNTEFYRRTWGEIGFKPEDFKTWKDFERLPTVSKADIQQHRSEMVAANYAEKDLVRNQTGGSTGEPLVFFLDSERKKTRAASTIRHDRWAGKDYSSRFACIWGHPGEAKGRLAGPWSRLRNRFISRAIYLDTSEISPSILSGYINQLLEERPQVYLAYANSIYLLAKYIREHHSGDYHKPKSIITSAEVLTDEMRSLIEDVFECKVFNRYGCRETSVIASECEQHSGMHVNAEALYLELLAGEVPATSGECGEVVITDLFNYGMPLIRYRIKDVAREIPGDCACGRGLPRIEMAGGRTTDFITTPEGKSVSGVVLATYLIAHSERISQAQLVQNSTSELTIKVVRGEGYSEAVEQSLMKSAHQFLGDSIRIDVQAQDEPIEVTGSGKHRFSVSNVSPF